MSYCSQAVTHILTAKRKHAEKQEQTFDAIEQALVGCIEGAQRAGDIDPSADGRQLAVLILAILRGIEALGKAGKSKSALRGIADAALAVLPRS